MYIDRPIKEYLADLAAKKPAPGGGSAAALGAAIGTSLMSMVANYTVGKPKYKDVEARAADILLKAGQFGSELELLIDKDVEAYGKLSKGLKECGDDAAKKDALFKMAIEPPLAVCQISYKCMELCRELADIGNKNLITDTAIAAIMFESAFFSAKFNVYINLECIKDISYIEKVHKAVAPIEKAMPGLKEEVLEMCEEVIDKLECR